MDRLRVLTETVQCPGCVVDSGTNCGHYEVDPETTACKSHVPGTRLFPGGLVYLGMPTGFTKVGPGEHAVCPIRLYVGNRKPSYNNLNVPVWALEEDGLLFVRVFSPRINRGAIDVIDGGKKEELCPNAIDVRPMQDTMD